MLLCGRILLDARFPPVIFPRILAGKDHARDAHFWDDSSRWTLSVPNFNLVPGAVGEFDGVF